MENNLTRKEDTSAIQKKTAEIVKTAMIKNRDAIMKTLPKGFNFDRMLRSLINAVSTTPLLAKCDAGSIFLSSIRAFALGIEPNGPLSEGYLIPFWNSKKATYEAQFMPSYRGLQNLSRRSGEIRELYAKAVYENDQFECMEGTERKLIHKPDYTKPRGKAVCYYACFSTNNNGFDFEVMSKAEIDAIRVRSKSAESGPWVTDYDEMAKKTVMRRLLKRAPMSIELASAVELDNKISMGESSDSILDIEGLEIPDETPAQLQKEVNAERTEAVKAKIEAAKGASK